MDFSFYKRGQGMLVRAGFLTGLLLLLFFGCYTLSEEILLQAEEVGVMESRVFTLPLVDFGVKWRQFIAGLLFGGGGLGLYLLLNRPRAADFLIETESEMKKVTWATGQEVRGATAVVIVMILFLSLTMFAFDYALAQLVNQFLSLARSSFMLT